jgi:hypothetical protein
MKREILDQTHESYDAQRWEELAALAEGGKRFHKLVDTFLPRNPMEPEQLYEMRKKHAKFTSYTGSLINLYASWLFVAGFEAKAYKKGSDEPLPAVDEFYGHFQEKVSGETTLKSFMKCRFREASKTGKSVWLCELPKVPDDVDASQLDRATYDSQGYGRARLVEFDPSELLNWKENEEGGLEWCVIKKSWMEQPSALAKRDTLVEQWRIYDAETVEIYEHRRQLGVGRKPTRHDDIKVSEEARPHGFKRVPVMRLCIPTEMCIGEQTYDIQLDHFQLDAALSWAIKRTCYPMPVFNIADDEKKPVMGVGYGIYLGIEEDLKWASPPSDSYETIARNRDAKREEIFRVVHAMAAGVDNNAETVGRSADSKEIDAAATRIMLNAYGEIVGKVIEETYETISEARGDSEIEWSVEGFSGYDTATASSLLGNIGLLKELGVPSKTAHRELSKKAALALVPEVDPRVKETIRKEIDSHDFEVSGDLLEKDLQTQQIDSQERVAEANRKSQEQAAKLALKAKANDSAKPKTPAK